ncbi:hypothetical protein SAMN04487943_10114 [Gracilibacillus orientalis]|uniref:Uncharacterized protein n=1 Tax=Gracilibacillus orientalis TaxID=334253 RepID=A0A1I4GV56_9BACI|nr:hypothetical protein [Gracilibacillus orientalis]SFL33217.1 hypothetical protein SAMN04487943_10114 [Gracilibacillus orientalis]
MMNKVSIVTSIITMIGSVILGTLSFNNTGFGLLTIAFILFFISSTRSLIQDLKDEKTKITNN